MTRPIIFVASLIAGGWVIGPSATAQPALPPGAVLRLGDARVYQPPAPYPGVVLLAPDGKTGLSAGGREVTFWDTATGAVKTRWRIPGLIGTIALSPDGKRLAVATGQGNVRLWDVATASQLQVWHASEDADAPIAALAFSPDSKRLASGSHQYGPSSDPFVRVWDVSDPKQVKPILSLRTAESGTLALAFSPNGMTLAAAEKGLEEYQRTDKNGTGADRPPAKIHVWDAVSGKVRRRLAGMEHGAAGLSFSADGTLLAASNHGETVAWEVATGVPKLKLRGVHVCASFAPTGMRLVVGGAQPGVWEARTGERLVHLGDPKSGPDCLADSERGHLVKLAAFAPDGQSVLTVNGQGLVSRWDTATGKDRFVRRGPVGAIAALAFSPDGHLIASGGADDTVRLWGSASGVLMRKLPPVPSSSADGNTVGLAFTTDGLSLVAAQRDWKYRVWDVATGALASEVKAHDRFIQALALDPRGKRAATRGGDGTVRIWDLAVGKEVRRLLPNEQIKKDAYLDALAYSRDGQTLATAAVNYVPYDPGQKEPTRPTVQLWDVESGRMLKELVPGSWTSRPGKLAFGRDGQVFVGYRFGALEQWDVKTGKRVRELIPYGRDIEDHEDAGRQPCPFAVSADGMLVAAGKGKRVLVFEASTGKQVRAFVGHALTVTAIAFSPDGKTVYTAGMTVAVEPTDGGGTLSYTQPARIALWDAATGKQGRALSLRGRFLALTPDGNTLIASGVRLVKIKGYLGRAGTTVDDVAWVWAAQATWWDLARDREVRTIFGKGEMPALSADGRLLLLGAETLQPYVNENGNLQFVRNRPDAIDPTPRLLEATTGRQVLLAEPVAATALALSSDGRTLAWGDEKGHVHWWDLTPAEPTAGALPADLWDTLAGPDSAAAFQAQWSLRSRPNLAVPFIKERLSPVAPEVSERFTKLLAQLSATTFDERDAADRELRKLGRTVLPGLRAALGDKELPVEARRRIETLVASLEVQPPTPEELRQVRAIAVLEGIASAEALATLKQLAGGAVQAQPTHEARAAIGRLVRPARTSPE